MTNDLAVFEECRASLLALAYRMLGDFSRGEDIVQEAWLRWSARTVTVDSPRAYLVKIVTRLCLNELDSARARKEEARDDRLPEPVDLSRQGLATVESLDQISMAFLVLLQRLSPAERAVLLLHDVFDFSHDEIGTLLLKTEQACRQLLKRARVHVADEREACITSQAEHRSMLQAFANAARSGDTGQLLSMLAPNAVLLADAGPDGGAFGKVRNISGPVVGAAKVAAFTAAVTAQGLAGLAIRECDLNGRPALLLLRDGKPQSAMMISVAMGKIRGIYIQADPERIKRLH